MKKTILTALVAIFSTVWAVAAETARQVLDKTAAAVGGKGGVSASFTMSGAFGNASGTLKAKGSKFHAATGEGIVWYDGTTQWTYVKKNNEVNVSTPSASQTLNPYKFINMYKSGYTSTLKTVGGKYEVHLTAQDAKRPVQEMYIVVEKSTYNPTQVKVRQKKGWTTFNVSNIKKGNVPDSAFRFNSKDYPSAEVIDLR